MFFKKGATSALDESVIADSKDVGASGVFDRALGEMALTFHHEDGQILDDETMSVWNIFGDAVSGPLMGSQLKPIVHGNHFWFSWVVFKPDTIIYKGAELGG